MMKKYLIICCCVLAGSMATYGATEWLDWSINLNEARSNASKGHNEARLYAQTLGQGIGDKNLTTHLASRFLSSSIEYSDPEYKAFLIMQNQKIIEQNERIIKLLEAQAKKK